MISKMDDHGCLILDIECLASSTTEKCASSPKMTKVLSRKGSSRIGRNNEDLEMDDVSLNVAKVSSCQTDQVKQLTLPIANKASLSIPINTNFAADVGDGKKRFNRLPVLHPRNILLFLATMSSMGTLLLIYFTLNIYMKGGPQLS